MATKSSLDAHLFHIKHLLILREQIAPFQVDFAVKEMSLDFSPVRNAGKSRAHSSLITFVTFCNTFEYDLARGLLKKRNRLFSLSTSNALLEFLLEGAPQLREHLTGQWFDCQLFLMRSFMFHLIVALFRFETAGRSTTEIHVRSFHWFLRRFLDWTRSRVPGQSECGNLNLNWMN